MSQEWDIKPLRGVCNACQKSFDDGQNYMSFLYFAEKEGYVRADFCEPCVPAESLQDMRRHSSWKGVFKAPPPKPPEPLQKETAETLLRRLIETGSDARRNVIFILAVMLERKKILVEKDVNKRDDGGIIRIYEHRRTGEMFVVPDPELKLTELEHVQQEVIEMLGGGQEHQDQSQSGQPGTPVNQESNA